jgi:hypothetical protein
MAFLIRPGKRIKKAKSKNSQEVLDRLERYLKSTEVTGEPVKILCGFWKDQQNAITYQELREAVENGEISDQTLMDWSQDYSVLVSEKLGSIWTQAMEAGLAGQPVMDGVAFEIDMQSAGVLNWIKERGAAFVSASTAEQKNAIASLLTWNMRETHSVDELARYIRPCIGLTESQAKANAKYYDNIVATLKKDHPRMKEESIRKKALDASRKYAERQHRQRAMTIAQTETAYAYNRGADEGIRQAQEQGLLGKMTKVWCTSGDDAVCDMCASLEGMEIDMDDSFEYRGKTLFPGQKMLPPAHPRCACAVEYVEVEDVRNTDLGSGNYEEELDENIQYLGEINPEKTDEAIEYYNEQIRFADTEHSVVIDGNGKVYYNVGSETNVSLKGIEVSGATITHNHPSSNGIVSFGKDDFEFLKDNQNIRKLIAVNEQFTYSVQVLEEMSDLSYSDYYRKAMMEAYADDMDFDIQHKVFEILDKDGFVKYVRERIE